MIVIMGMVKDSLFEYEPLLKHFTLTMDCGLLKILIYKKDSTVLLESSKIK